MPDIIIKLLLFAVILTALVFWIYTRFKEENRLTKKQRKVLIRIIIAAAIALILQFLPLGRILRLIFYLVAYIVIGGDILKKAFSGVKNKKIFSESFLMTVATLGALALAVYSNGDYLEAIAVMLFYQLGELFQSYAVGKSRKSIGALMDIRPDYANIEVNGELQAVDPETIEVGSIIVVRAGEKVAIDGIIVEGESSVNTADLTGESIPRDVKVGDQIVSGFINISGLLKIRTTKPFAESTATKILELVENASSRKSKSEDFIAKFARVYTPAVCFAALALAFVPPLFRVIFLNASAELGIWVYRALTFLVISCPCALVISIPLSFFAGIGGASREGILIKGSNYMETLSKVKTVVFDKTGTLTKGNFEVSRIDSVNLAESELLEYAALTERTSIHPIARSITSAYENSDCDKTVTQTKEYSGLGIISVINAKTVAVGNIRLMEKLEVKVDEFIGTGTAVYVAIDNSYEGRIIISDTIKEGSKKAIEGLKKIGVGKTVMLTGDISAVANSVGKEIGITEIHSELLPGDKVEEASKLLEKRAENGVVAAVGDGINDAPVLSVADIGIAMGGIGSDAAIEAADIVIMDDAPEKVVKSIKIAKRCLSIVYQNTVFALGVKFACLVLGALGIANMWLAIFADVGVMVIAVLNAIRALYVKSL